MISLSKNIHAREYYKYKNTVLPIRHLAPEVLDDLTYSAASDVFACGITFWEILTYGRYLPHQNINPDELFDKLKSKSIDFENLLKTEKISNEIQNKLVIFFSKIYRFKFTY